MPLRCRSRSRSRLVLLLLLLLLLPLLLQLQLAAAVGRLRKKSARTRPCLDLPEEVLEQMFGRLSVGVMSAFHHALQLEPRDALNASCPLAARSLGGGRGRLPVNLLSVSPWAYRLSYDPTRFPRYIPEAYCLCRGCLLGGAGSQEESQQHRSAPVFAPSVILKRTGSCVAGRHSYTEVYVSVAVGCTCVPLLEGERSQHSGNHSLERAGPRARPRPRPLPRPGTRPRTGRLPETQM